MKVAIDRLSRWLAAVGGVAIGIMMIIMIGDAIARKVIAPVPGAYETVIGLMVAILLLPQGYGQLQRANVVMDLLSQRLPVKVSATINLIGSLLMLAAVCWLTYLGWVKAWEATSYGEVLSGIVYYPIWIFRWLIPLGFSCLALQLIDTARSDFLILSGKG